MPDYDQGVQTPEGEIRVHLLRCTAFEPPTAALRAAAGGVFKPISALRGYPPVELALVREVFNLIVGGAGHWPEVKDTAPPAPRPTVAHAR
jgi:hypothetical protein